MSFRSSAIASSSSGGNLTATPAGVAAHDYLGAIWVADGTAEAPTPPAGWTLRVTASGGADGQCFRYYDKDDASGSDSFTFTYAGGSPCVLICAAWSGRDNANPRSTTPVTTAFAGSNAGHPISFTITGISATAGDDIAVWACTDDASGGSRWTFSTISGFTERNDGANQDWASGALLQTLDNAAGGATGNFSTTISDSGVHSGDRAAIVVAIKASSGAAAASFLPPPTNPMSHLLVR